MTYDPMDYDDEPINVPAPTIDWSFIWQLLAIALLVLTLILAFFNSKSHGQDIKPVPDAGSTVTFQSIDYSNVVIPDNPLNPIPISIYRLHDADTITDCTIHLPFDVDLPHSSIRCYGFDAWEVNRSRQSESAGPITDDEIHLGLKAKDDLIQLLLVPSKANFAENRLYVEDSGIRDPYGRRLCWWWIKQDNPNGYTWLNVAAWGRAKGYQRSKQIPH